MHGNPVHATLVVSIRSQTRAASRGRDAAQRKSGANWEDESQDGCENDAGYDPAGEPVHERQPQASCSDPGEGEDDAQLHKEGRHEDPCVGDDHGGCDDHQVERHEGAEAALGP